MRVINVSKAYKEKAVLKNISVDIPPQKVTSFIGPNGAGKSSLLNIMSRLSCADSGEVLLKGKNLASWKSADLSKNLAILTQTNHITGRFTVRELVSFGRFPYSQGRLNKEDIAKIDYALEYMELTDLQNNLLTELSGGQRQRALICMVLAQDTDYLLLDEPTASLDIYHSTKLMQIIRRLCDDLGKTVVMVLHDINYAAFYSDNICAFVAGKLLKSGGVVEVIEPQLLKTIYQVEFDVIKLKDKPFTVHF